MARAVAVKAAQTNGRDIDPEYHHGEHATGEVPTLQPRKKEAPESASRCIPSTRTGYCSVENNFHTAVLWLTHIRPRRDQQVRIAISVHGDHVLRHTVTNQFGGDNAGATLGQTLVV